MGADFYIAKGHEELKSKKLPILLTLESNACYWFLYHYFERANLDRRHELIDLYGGAEIDGYQLDRLEDELKVALLDIANRAENWKVLVGWKSEEISRETEDWRSTEKKKLTGLVQNLLGLIGQARESGLKLVYLGD